MGKFSDFIQKYGYSYKSFFIALFVFPPAALFIAWKMPDLSVVVRILFTILGITVPLLPFILGGLGLSKLSG
ncbi:hypothetical protein [Saccharicrinis sp. FJH54]|uniref:hypothetical protein n=1 Tax=Saccharicrinis sp. FJH54 TaxID=3344665 RepID=UPI0035D42C52